MKLLIPSLLLFVIFSPLYAESPLITWIDFDDSPEHLAYQQWVKETIIILEESLNWEFKPFKIQEVVGVKSHVHRSDPVLMGIYGVNRMNNAFEMDALKAETIHELGHVYQTQFGRQHNTSITEIDWYREGFASILVTEMQNENQLGMQGVIYMDLKMTYCYGHQWTLIKQGYQHSGIIIFNDIHMMIKSGIINPTNETLIEHVLEDPEMIEQIPEYDVWPVLPLILLLSTVILYIRKQRLQLNIYNKEY